MFYVSNAELQGMRGMEKPRRGCLFDLYLLV